MSNQYPYDPREPSGPAAQFQQHPPQGSYAPQQPVYPPPVVYQTAPPTNTLAIVSLVGAFTFPIVGIVCGHLALGQIKRTGEGGHGLAVAGLIISYFWTAIAVLYVIFLLLLMLGIGLGA